MSGPYLPFYYFSRLEMSFALLFENNWLAWEVSYESKIFIFGCFVNRKALVLIYNVESFSFFCINKIVIFFMNFALLETDFEALRFLFITLLTRRILDNIYSSKSLKELCS